jgi:hypothetical protein
VLSAGAGVAAAEAAVHHAMVHSAHHARHHAHHAHHANLGSSVQGPTIQGSSGALPANISTVLQALYLEYKAEGGGSNFTPSLPTDRLLVISGTSVAVNLKIGSGTNFNTALAQLQSDGLQVGASSSTYDLIEGMLPIGELPVAAQIAASVTPVPPPQLS